MKIITLMRHAKSSWKDGHTNDMDRPLLRKGLSRTRQVIDYLKNNDFNPDFIITSPALRASETAKIMAHAFSIDDTNYREESQLYAAQADDYYDQCFDLPQTCVHVLMVGHNPAITGFANLFLDTKIDYLPTSGVISVAFDTEKWEDLPLSSRRVQLVLFPKMIS
ncbi:MAG: histidine phosphatase family protein [Lentimicrobium sp.]|jgi:phosphohistidine phosphatase|nr:histidine phosphatase family protein [Lentimicrobium sp.]